VTSHRRHARIEAIFEEPLKRRARRALARSHGSKRAVAVVLLFLRCFGIVFDQKVLSFGAE